LFFPSVNKSVPPARCGSNPVARKDEERSVEIVDLSELDRNLLLQLSRTQQIWLNLCSATQQEMDDNCSSILKISLSHLAIDLICNITVEEVHSAFGLDESRHVQTTDPVGHVIFLLFHWHQNYATVCPGKENDFAIVRPGCLLFDNHWMHFAVNESNNALSSDAMESELLELI